MPLRYRGFYIEEKEDGRAIFSDSPDRPFPSLLALEDYIDSLAEDSLVDIRAAALEDRS